MLQFSLYWVLHLGVYEVLYCILKSNGKIDVCVSTFLYILTHLFCVTTPQSGLHQFSHTLPAHISNSLVLFLCGHTLQKVFLFFFNSFFTNSLFSGESLNCLSFVHFYSRSAPCSFLKAFKMTWLIRVQAWLSFIIMKKKSHGKMVTLCMPQAWLVARSESVKKTQSRRIPRRGGERFIFYLTIYPLTPGK